mmetsp:Transcript_55805/g.174920  ORF Transcript_55805/g.174920 Transcript_55805/m.174920 type:complete len:264 (-) Transcript_55805:2-793(-)
MSRPARSFSSSAACSDACFSARWRRVARLSARSERPAPRPSTRATRSERRRGSVLFTSSRCSVLCSCCLSPWSRTSIASFSRVLSRARSRSPVDVSTSSSARCLRSSAAATCFSTNAAKASHWLPTASWRSAFCDLACSPSSRTNSERRSLPMRARSSSGRPPHRSSTACRRWRTRELSLTRGSSCWRAWCTWVTTALCASAMPPREPTSLPRPAWAATTIPVRWSRSRHSAGSELERGGITATAMLAGGREARGARCGRGGP